MRLWIIQCDEPHSSVKSICVWQSLMEMKDHSITHSKCITSTAFRVLYWSASVTCGAHTHFIDSSDVHASVIHGSTVCCRYSLVPQRPGYVAPSDIALFRGTRRSHWIELCVHLVCIQLALRKLLHVLYCIQ